MTDISIIIVHYNSPKETQNCLKSLATLDTTDLRIHIVVVDNGSKDVFDYNTKKPEVEILRSESNLGFTGGNNMGIYYAIEKYNSDFVLLLNSDTQISPPFLRTIVRYMEEHPKIGIASPKIYFSPGREFHSKSYTPAQRGKVIWYAGGSIDWQHLVAFHRGVDEYDYGQFDEETQSEFATGCCAILRREVLEKIGGFDRRYFLYFEDVDITMRAIQAGYAVGFCPQAHIWHINAGSSEGSGSQIHQYYQTRNRYLFYQLHSPPGYLWSMLRLLVHQMIYGSWTEKQAILHFIIRQFGKQQLV